MYNPDRLTRMPDRHDFVRHRDIREKAKTEQREFTEPELDELIADAFWHQRYPLTAVGEQLLRDTERILHLDSDSPERAQKLLNLREHLPTVENPRLDELFAPLQLESEKQQQEIFGLPLHVIQFSEGCSRGCSTCEGDATNLKDTMPYAAALRIGEEKKRFESIFLQFIDGLSKSKKVEKNSEKEINDKINKFTSQFKDRYLIWELKMRTVVNNSSLPRKFNNVSLHYNNEFFDAQDRTFLHKNGLPADPSDYAMAVSSAVRPSRIITSLWHHNAKLAPIGAEKLANMPSEMIELVRISINPYSREARNNLQNYLQVVLEGIDILAKLDSRLEILFRDDEDEQFIKQVKQPVLEHIKKIKSTGLWPQVLPDMKTSYFSKRFSSGQRKPDDPDGAACFPGYHLHPDGGVYYQPGKENFITYLSSVELTAPKGARPQPTGQRLYTLRDFT